MFDNWKKVKKGDGFFISQVYKEFRGDFEKKFWKDLICLNLCFFKSKIYNLVCFVGKSKNKRCIVKVEYEY